MGVTVGAERVMTVPPPERAEAGTHTLMDLHGVSPERLTDAELFSGLLLQAARAAGATPLSGPVIHRFPGGGLTAFLPLSESHIAAHTYPERGYLAADVFTCGACSSEAAVAVFRETLRPAREEIRSIVRGALPGGGGGGDG